MERTQPGTLASCLLRIQPTLTHSHTRLNPRLMRNWTRRACYLLCSVRTYVLSGTTDRWRPD